MDLSTNLALARALQQNGVTMKAQLMATGYGQNLLDQPVAKTLGPDVVFGSIWAPVEVHNKATERLQSDLKKYAGYTGIPDIGVYTGYIACDLAIIGLQRQGQDLDQATFSDNLRSVGTVNPGAGTGLLRHQPQPRDLWQDRRHRRQEPTGVRVVRPGQGRQVRDREAEGILGVVLDR